MPVSPVSTRSILLLAILTLSWAQLAGAHHGWRWATDEEFELTGTIVVARLGNPHGELTLDVDGKRRIAEIGQPWRNREAGLTDDLLLAGRVVTLHGHRAAAAGQLLMKVERVIIDGQS